MYTILAQLSFFSAFLRNRLKLFKKHCPANNCHLTGQGNQILCLFPSSSQNLEFSVVLKRGLPFLGSRHGFQKQDHLGIDCSARSWNLSKRQQFSRYTGDLLSSDTYSRY